MAGLAKLQLLIEIKDKLNVGLNSARQTVDRAVGGMQRRLNAFSDRATQAFGGLADQIPGVGSALSMLANPAAIAATAVAAIGTAIVKCTMAANDWHKQMAEINVTAELSRDKLAGLSNKLLEIGGRNAAPLEEVPKAFNKIISAGLSVEDSLATVEPTLRAAKAGFVDIETAASAATSVMMSAGVDAKKTFDVLFATQKAGNAEFKDIANYLPKVIPLARNVGFALEETAGAFASLTGSLKPEAAATALEGMMRSLSDAKVVNSFKGIGIDVFDVDTGKAKPIIDILAQLDKSMAGLSDKERMLKFDKLGLDQSSTLGFSTLIQNLPKVKSDINDVINSAGAMEKAYTDSLTPFESWSIIQNKIKVEMIKIGELFLPMASAIGNKILDIINYWRDLYNNSVLFRDLLSAIGLVWEYLFSMSTLGLNLTINLGKLIYSAFTGIVEMIGNWISGITGVKGSFTDMYNSVRPYLIWLKDFLTQIGSLMYDIVTMDLVAANDKIINFKLPELKEVKQKLIIIPEIPKVDKKGDFTGVTTNTGTGASGFTPTGAGASSIADGTRSIQGGSQTKNTTINIDSFIKGFSPTHQSFQNMSDTEFERKMTDIFMRIVRSAETSN